MHAFTATAMPPLLAHPSFCPHLHLLARLLSCLAHVPLPSLPVRSPLSLPLHLAAPSSPTTSSSSLTSSPIHLAISTLTRCPTTPARSPSWQPPLPHLAFRLPPLLGGMGEGIAGKAAWVWACVLGFCVCTVLRARLHTVVPCRRPCRRTYSCRYMFGCSGVSVGKHTRGSWRTCRRAYVGLE